MADASTSRKSNPKGKGVVRNKRNAQRPLSEEESLEDFEHYFAPLTEEQKVTRTTEMLCKPVKNPPWIMKESDILMEKTPIRMTVHFPHEIDKLKRSGLMFNKRYDKLKVNMRRSSTPENEDDSVSTSSDTANFSDSDIDREKSKVNVRGQHSVDEFLKLSEHAIKFSRECNFFAKAFSTGGQTKEGEKTILSKDALKLIGTPRNKPKTKRRVNEELSSDEELCEHYFKRMTEEERRTRTTEMLCKPVENPPWIMKESDILMPVAPKYDIPFIDVRTLTMSGLMFNKVYDPIRFEGGLTISKKIAQVKLDPKLTWRATGYKERL